MTITFEKIDLLNYTDSYIPPSRWGWERLEIGGPAMVIPPEDFRGTPDNYIRALAWNWGKRYGRKFLTHLRHDGALIIQRIDPAIYPYKKRRVKNG